MNKKEYEVSEKLTRIMFMWEAFYDSLLVSAEENKAPGHLLPFLKIINEELINFQAFLDN